MSAAAIKMVEEALAEKNKAIEAKVGNDLVERDELLAALKKLTKGSKTGNSTPATSDEDLIAAVAHVSKSGPAKTTDIAKFLEVDSRTIARRLSALAQNAEVAVEGNKDDGYTA